MAAVRGRPASRVPAQVSSVGAIKAVSGKSQREYTVDVRVAVQADSPAEAVYLVQDTLLGEGGTKT